MKIGILSMQRVVNYGSFMQALALKSILEEMGHEIQFVDFRIEPTVYERKKWKQKIRCKVKNVKRRFFNDRRLESILHSDQPNRMIMHSCNQILGITDNYHFSTKVDLLIIGSDEVFNCTQPNDNVGFALDLFGKRAKAKRVITYAASFGYTTLERLFELKIDQEIKGLLNNIDAISVRDENSRRIVASLCGFKPCIHADPVLIGGIENIPWKAIKAISKNPYMIIYGYRNRFAKDECEDILRFAHKMGLKLIALGENQVLCDENIFCKPDEIVEYFRHAAYVVTDTFHGTIFSVITHRPFLIISRSTAEKADGNSQKIGSLVKQLKIEGRLVTNFSNIEEKMKEEIDYVSIDHIRSLLRQEALNYLAQQIKAVKN